MNFFELSFSHDPKIVGKISPQVEGVYPISPQSPEFISNAVKDFTEIDRYIAVPLAKQSKKTAKLTDLINYWAVGFWGRLLVSDKLKQIIEHSDQIGNQFLETKVFDFSGTSSFTYWLINTYVFFPEYIDYAKSELWLKGSGGIRLERIFCDSFDDYEHKQRLKAPVPIKVEKVILNNYIIEYDFFSVNNTKGAIRYFISEKLKNEIEKAGCTGIDFIEV